MRYSARFWKSLLASSVLVFGAFLAFPAVAAEMPTCSCWCGSATAGASDHGDLKDASTCASACRKENLRLVGCFTSELNEPPFDDKCWTKSECTGKKDENGAAYLFSDKNAFDCKSPMRYCYAPISRRITLNAPIAGTTSLGGLDEYVKVVYRFLIGAGVLVAVVMVVIAGFQWTSSRGNASQVGKAKERIESAMVGLLLLLAAYVVARVIDPRLVEINPIRVPQLKDVVLLSGADSCEALENAGFTIKAVENSTECGKRGEIAEVKNVQANVQSTLKVGDECKFSGCNASNKVCVSVAGNAPTCTTCADAASALTLGQRTATNALQPVCGQVENALNNQPKDPNILYQCVFDTEFVNECIPIYTTKDYIDCDVMRQQAQSLKDPCKLYDDRNTLKYEGDQKGEAATRVGELCKRDVCKLAPLAGFAGCDRKEISTTTRVSEAGGPRIPDVTTTSLNCTGIGAATEEQQQNAQLDALGMPH